MQVTAFRRNHKTRCLQSAFTTPWRPIHKRVLVLHGNWRYINHLFSRIHTCIHGTAPTYLADELLQPADLGIRTRPPTIGVDHITAGPLYTVSYRRGPSFSCRRCPISGTTCRATSTSRPRHLSRLNMHLFRRSFP